MAVTLLAFGLYRENKISVNKMNLLVESKITKKEHDFMVRTIIGFLLLLLLLSTISKNTEI